MALLYACSVPNFILAFIPAEISTETLNTMTAFAVSFRLLSYDAIQFIHYIRQGACCRMFFFT